MDKQTIQDAALDLFKKISFEKTSVSDIARACGIGKGTFYLYFKSKNEIFSSILEERLSTTTERYTSFYSNPYIPLETKIQQYIENQVDDYFLFKDLLFGSFEKVQGRMIQDVFLKYGKYYHRSIDNLCSIIRSNGDVENPEYLRVRVEEWIDVLLGRMLMFIMINNWNDREGLKRIISPLSAKLYASLVAA